ncbi:MAG: hypothetical protein PHY64_11690 [Eubacteriales bacterium]|nr:hypothetical protein [Eubacteriales bacterium]
MATAGREPANPGTKAGNAIELIPDDHGVYRWTYEMNLLKNPVVGLTVLKIFASILAGIALFLFFLTLGEGFAEAAGVFVRMIGYGLPVIIVLVLLALGITALLQGGSYRVQFTMDEHGITHRQDKAQFVRARKAAGWTALLGSLAGNPSATGAGILAGLKGASKSDFRKVKSIKPRRVFHTILLRGGMEFNQIYAAPEQYEFVLAYIRAHCPKAAGK